MRAALFDPDLDDFDVMLAAHAAFHSAVAKATGNPLFELVTRPLYHASYGEDLVGSLPAGYWARIDADHRELLDCLTAAGSRGGHHGGAPAPRLHRRGRERRSSSRCGGSAGGSSRADRSPRRTPRWSAR